MQQMQRASVRPSYSLLRRVPSWVSRSSMSSKRSHVGCCVSDSTRSQVRPAGLSLEGDAAAMSPTGRRTDLLLTMLDVKPV